MIEEKRYADISAMEAQSNQREGLKPTHDLVDYARRYAREKPIMVAAICLGVGFILGWKLKPW
jgi:ElaB/YqjD/DUF883 family membrane-anchored ribosome-binding protein